jgi:hypothetical protein
MHISPLGIFGAASHAQAIENPASCWQAISLLLFLTPSPAQKGTRLSVLAHLLVSMLPQEIDVAALRTSVARTRPEPTREGS